MPNVKSRGTTLVLFSMQWGTSALVGTVGRPMRYQLVWPWPLAEGSMSSHWDVSYVEEDSKCGQRLAVVVELAACNKLVCPNPQLASVVALESRLILLENRHAVSLASSGIKSRVVQRPKHRTLLPTTLLISLPLSSHLNDVQNFHTPCLPEF